jgi:hypothetical protein
MSSVLDGIKGLMRGCKGLPDDMSATEINHYAMEVVKRLKRGETAPALEQYLRRIKAPGRAQPHVSLATRELAERAFVLVNKPG